MKRINNTIHNSILVGIHAEQFRFGQNICYRKNSYKDYEKV